MTIYFIHDEKSRKIKIGYTSKNDVSERLKDLQTGNGNELKVIGTIKGDQKKEKELHERFQDKRSTGEWFSVSKKEILPVIKENGGQIVQNVKKQKVKQNAEPKTFSESIKEKYPNLHSSLNENSIKDLANVFTYIEDFEIQNLEDALAEINNKLLEWKLPDGVFLNNVDFNAFLFKDNNQNKKAGFLIKPNFNFNLHVNVTRAK